MDFKSVGRFWNSAAILTLNVLVLFAVLNVVSWLWMRATATRPATPRWEIERGSGRPLTDAHPLLSESDIAMLMEETRTRTHGYEAFTGHLERPFTGRFVNVDSNGYRHGDGGLPWPPVRGGAVFVFGGSTTFGFGVQDSETIPRHLQELLRSRYGDRIAVYNFGRGYYYSSQERALFSQLLERGIVPDLALFIDGLNEFQLEPPYAARLRRVMDGEVQRVSTLERVPVVRIGRRIMSRMRRPAAAPENAPARAQDEMSTHSVLSRYLANRRMSESIGAAFGVPTLFVWQPVPTYKYDISNHLYWWLGSANSNWLRAAGERTRVGYEQLAALTAASRPSPGFLWLADLQEGLTENLYVDRVHYTGAMNRRIAAAIAERILEAGWLAERRRGDGPSR